MKKILLTIIICLFFSGVSYSENYPAYVTNIVDGDTIDVTLDLGFGVSLSDRVRLLDYDAPETYRPGSPQEKALGEKAKEFIKEKILGKGIVLGVPKKERGKYGRILGVVYLRGENINELMKEMGFVKEDR